MLERRALRGTLPVRVSRRVDGDALSQRWVHVWVGDAFTCADLHVSKPVNPLRQWHMMGVRIESLLHRIPFTSASLSPWWLWLGRVVWRQRCFVFMYLIISLLLRKDQVIQFLDSQLKDWFSLFDNVFFVLDNINKVKIKGKSGFGYNNYNSFKGKIHPKLIFFFLFVISCCLECRTDTKRENGSYL